MNREAIAAARELALHVEKRGIGDAVNKAARLLELLALLDDPAEPPPNTVRVRIAVDVGAPYGEPPRSYVEARPHRADNHLCRKGLRRSVVVADVPVPAPIAEIVGTVEGS